MPTTPPSPDVPTETAARPPRRAVLLAAAGVAGLVVTGLTGCSRGDDPSPEPSADTGATPDVATGAPPDAGAGGVTAAPVHLTVLATATVDVMAVHEAPSDPDDAAEEAAGALRTSLDRTTEISGQLVFVVLTEGAAWHEVQLPVRPNGSVGWVRARDVSLTGHGFAVDVALCERRVVVTDGGADVLSTPIGLGTEDTPTPGGAYYVKELLQPPDPGGAYGPYAYGLSGFSNVLGEFAGGQGVIGIHGTNQPELIGQQVSSGCIRLPNDAIVRLVEEIGLPLGTPVAIRA